MCVITRRSPSFRRALCCFALGTPCWVISLPLFGCHPHPEKRWGDRKKSLLPPCGGVCYLHLTNCLFGIIQMWIFWICWMFIRFGWANTAVCVFAGGFAGLPISAGLDVPKCWVAAAAEDGLWNRCWRHSPSQTQLPAQVAHHSSSRV